jgi:hypothetical protein
VEMGPPPVQIQSFVLVFELKIDESELASGIKIVQKILDGN